MLPCIYLNFPMHLQHNLVPLLVVNFFHLTHFLQYFGTVTANLLPRRTYQVLSKCILYYIEWQDNQDACLLMLFL